MRRDLLAVELGTATGVDIVALVLGEQIERRALVQTPAIEGAAGATLSPDGRWLAYVADPTGTQEIWVRPYPGPGAAARLSPNGGFEPVWARSGRELFYREGAKLVATSIQPGAELQFTPPASLFEGDYIRPSNQPPTYAVAPDGRFLFLKVPAGFQAQPLTVVVNWIEELARRARPE